MIKQIVCCALFLLVPASVGAGPNVTAPEAGAEASYRQAIIEWEPVGGVMSYHLEIDDDPNFRSPEVDVVTSEPRFALRGLPLKLNYGTQWPAYVRINGERWDAFTFAAGSIPQRGSENELAVAGDGTVHMTLKRSVLYHATSDDWSHQELLSLDDSFNIWTVDMEADPLTGDVHTTWFEQRWGSPRVGIFYAGELSNWQPVLMDQNYEHGTTGWTGPSVLPRGGVVDVYQNSSLGIVRYRTMDGATFTEEIVWSGLRTNSVQAVADPDGFVVLGSDIYPNSTVISEAAGFSQLLEKQGRWPGVGVSSDGVVHVTLQEHGTWEMIYSNSDRGFSNWTRVPIGSANQDTRPIAFDSTGRIYTVGNSTGWKPRLVWSDDMGYTWSYVELPGSSGIAMDVEVGSDDVVHVSWNYRGQSYANSLGAFLATNFPPNIYLGAPAYTNAKVVIPADVIEQDQEDVSGEVVVSTLEHTTQVVELFADVEVLPGLSVHYEGNRLSSFNAQFRLEGHTWWDNDIDWFEVEGRLPLTVEVRSLDRTVEGSFVIVDWPFYGQLTLDIVTYVPHKVEPWSGTPPAWVNIESLPSNVPVNLRVLATDSVNTVEREQDFVKQGQDRLILYAGLPTEVDSALSDIISTLPPVDFSNEDKEAVLVQHIHAVIASARAAHSTDMRGEDLGATVKRLKHLRLKTDGCELGVLPDSNDWVNDCNRQLDIYLTAIDALIAVLDGIT